MLSLNIFRGTCTELKCIWGNSAWFVVTAGSTVKLKTTTKVSKTNFEKALTR